MNEEGLVSVEYDELNLQEVRFFYGIDNYNEVVLNNCPSGKKQRCETFVDFSAFDGETISAYFVVKDNANEVMSKIMTWNVDVSEPEFSQVVSNQNGNKMVFDLEATETADFLYKEAGTDLYKILCKNKTNQCIKEKTFTQGPHLLDLMAKDMAGNFDIEQISFNV